MRAILILFFVSLLTGVCDAASLCVAVSSSGTADGSDWNNALGASFTPVRGNTYYLADGDYGGKTWNTATSGSSLITIRKATSAGHVTDTGWSASMGDGVAVYSGGIVIDSDYWTLDGVTGADRTGHGLEVVGETTIGSAANGPSDNITIQYVNAHIFPSSDGLTEKGDYSDVTGWLPANFKQLFKINWAGTNINFRYCYLHRVFGCPWQTLAVNHVLIEHCFIEKNKNTAAWHAAGIADAAGSSDWTIRYNKWCDIEGSAFIENISTATVTSYRWNIYGNVFYHTGTWGGGCTVSAGIVVWNDGSNHGTAHTWNVLNNTFSKISGDPYISFVSATGTNLLAHNNLWWQDRGSIGDPTAYVNKVYVSLTGYGNTYSHNFYSAAACPGFFTVGTGEPAHTAGPNCPLWPIPANTPFVDRANANFNLTTGFAGEMTAGLDTTSLVPGNSVDGNGRTRGFDGTWDRGAFEFPPPGAPPAILNASGTARVGTMIRP